MFIQIPIQTILLRFLRSSSNFPEIITEFIYLLQCREGPGFDLFSRFMLPQYRQRSKSYWFEQRACTTRGETFVCEICCLWSLYCNLTFFKSNHICVVLGRNILCGTAVGSLSQSKIVLWRTPAQIFQFCASAHDTIM